MDDVRLWRLLRTDPLPRRELASHLRGLAETPLWARVPYLGFLGPLLRDANVEVRAAALTALGGTHGYLAHRALIEALDGPDTRMEAVDALRACTRRANPCRWAHVLFHPDPDVRGMALDLAATWPETVPASFLRHLLHDQVNGDVARQWLERLDEGSDAGVVMPAPEPFYVPTAPLSDDERRLQQEVESALDAGAVAADMAGQLERYLQLGHAVSFSRRCQVACAQRDLGLDTTNAFPILLQNDWHPNNSGNSNPQDYNLFSIADPAWIVPATKSLLMADPPMEVDGEYKLFDLLVSDDWQKPEIQEALGLLVTYAKNPAVRNEARGKLQPSLARTIQLHRVARSFAWGKMLGRVLTGQPYRIEYLVNEQLGYTRFNEEVLYISPMPILRDEPDGEAVVRGLILHEYGHHLYHKSDEALAVWDKADKSGLGKLLNLTADEHLERNLRQLDSRYGHLLKRLNSYAFQYRRREIRLQTILDFLGEHAFDVLTQIRLRTARDANCILVQNGRLLRAMEAQGISFARFMRALRMGMGNRYGDPKVKEALALFRGGFRRFTMDQLYHVAERLREIFGEETRLLDWMSQDECLRWSDNDDLPSRDEMQKAMGSGLPGDEGQKKSGRRPAAWGINLDPNVQFNKIDKVVPLQHDPLRHADYANKVAREAQLLRRWLDDLGLKMTPQTQRTQGRRLDRRRMLDLILRNDPRVLISRKLERATDLFLGVMIDCSSSMGGERIEKAKTFGTLLAEAVKNQRGIDLRLFGFTDLQIFDAGTARRCAVHALNAFGGNNDAAALQHAFECAQASARKAKLLVMISDGLPSNCSVAALQHLVSRLTRRRYCCAQVAVAPLDQVCFPHYILLNDQQLADSVRKFGAVIRRLVQQALGLA